MYAKLILDVGPEFDEFKHKLTRVDDLEEFVTEAITQILEYIMDESNALASIDEYVEVVKEAISETKDITLAEDIAEAVREFGIVLFLAIQKAGGYEEDEGEDKDGVLRYKFSEVLGHDIVLAPLTPEDLSST